MPRCGDKPPADNPGIHERVKDGARSVSEGVKADALLMVDGLGSVMRGVKSRGFPFGKPSATSLPPAGVSTVSETQEPRATPCLDEVPPVDQPAPPSAPELLPRVDSLERLLAEAPALS